MHSLRAWIDASRPKTLWAGIAPVIIGTTLAWEDQQFHLLAALASFLGALAIQIGTNFANDYFDYVKGADTAKRTGPVRATQAGLISPQAMFRAAGIAFSCAILIGIFLVYRGGWPILAVGVLSIVCGYLYTAGPHPLAYRGLGELFVLIFFGVVAVAGTYWVQAGALPMYVVLAGIPPGLLSTAVLVVNNLRDIPTDRVAGKRTLAVRFGESFARSEFFLCVFLSATIPYLLHMLTGRSTFSVLTVYLIAIAWPLMQSVARDEGELLNRTLARTAQLLLIYTILFGVGWLL